MNIIETISTVQDKLNILLAIGDYSDYENSDLHFKIPASVYIIWINYFGETSQHKGIDVIEGLPDDTEYCLCHDNGGTTSIACI
jgi:hypothetical protein